MHIKFITDLPTTSARKQNRALSYTEARELKICADMGEVPEIFSIHSILPSIISFQKPEEIYTLERSVATRHRYLEGKEGGAYVNPRIVKFREAFLAYVETLPRNTVLVPLRPAVFYFLTGEEKFFPHIGSIERSPFGHYVIPVYHSELLFRTPERRLYNAAALSRAYKILSGELVEPLIELLIEPSPEEALREIERLLDEKRPVSADIETVARHISCIAYGNDPKRALSIPFITHDSGNYKSYYSLADETRIVQKSRQLLTENECIWQNGSYDIAHIMRAWGFVPNNTYDTMLLYHSMYPGLKKDLATLGSLYVPWYQYWKDEHKDFTTLPEDLRSYWTYNAKDTLYTLIIKEKLLELVEKEGTREQWKLLQQSNRHLDRISLRGVRIDKAEKERLAQTLMPELDARRARIDLMAGHPLNTGSSVQMKKFFYEDLKQPVQKNKKTWAPSCDEQALEAIAVEEPLLRPLVDVITESRSIGVFLSTFVMMQLDIDGRMRCSYNVGGPETYRLSSSKNPFGSGGNLQNIPKGQEDEEREGYKLPNLRKMFIPDEGMLLFDVDLAGADAQIVAWEADDQDLKDKFRSGAKIHALNAIDMYGAKAGVDGKAAPYYKYAKMGTHLSNYGGTPKTLSKACGMLMHEAELFQRRWFEMHPGISDWQERVKGDLQSTGIIKNKFGFRRVFFDRPDSAYTNALAWIPQSSIAIVIHKAMENIIRELRRVDILLQVHDSLAGQFPIAYKELYLPKIKECMKVVVPYDDPLVIGTSLDISTKSWGELESWS